MAVSGRSIPKSGRARLPFAQREGHGAFMVFRCARRRAFLLGFAGAARNRRGAPRPQVEGGMGVTLCLLVRGPASRPHFNFRSELKARLAEPYGSSAGSRLHSPMKTRRPDRSRLAGTASTNRQGHCQPLLDRLAFGNGGYFLPKRLTFGGMNIYMLGLYCGVYIDWYI